MTPQEIDRIECAIRHIQTSTDIDPWAAEIAVEAMRKQIPQRPVIGYAFPDKLREVMKRTDHEKAETKTDCCPVCGRTLGVSKFVQTQSGLRFGDQHCKRCGQAIDWEDVRDDEHIADVSKKVERASDTAQNVQDEDLISKLSEIRSEYNCFDEDGEPQYRALSEAIRILSQLADGDTISRQMAIDTLARMMPRSYTPDGSHPADEEIFRAQEVFADCIEVLEILPSAAPSTAHTTETTAETTAPSTDDWIPVERELPEDLAEVNVTWVNHEPEPYYESIKSKPFTASAVYYEGNWYWYSSVCADVLAEYGRNDVDKVDDTIEITAWKPLPEPYRGGEK